MSGKKMAATFLGPEDPRPMAVISETYRDDLQLQLPDLPAWDRYSMGPQYELQLFTLLEQYMDLGTTDTLCYVGDTKDFLIHRLEDHFCLTTPVQTVVPGHVHYEETKDHKMLPFNISHVGAEEFFRQLISDRDELGSASTFPLFDKILVHDACRYLSDSRTFYSNLMRCLAPGGVLLILHRPARLSTLPFFKEAQTRLSDNDIPHMDIIHDLHTVPQVTVRWELETIPVRIQRTKWLAMLRDRYPPHLQMMSQTEVLGGLRELAEGVLKYGDDMVEFNDRLMFVRVTHKHDLMGDSWGQSLSSPLTQPAPLMSPVQRHLKFTMALPTNDTKKLKPIAQSPSTFKFMWG